LYVASGITIFFKYLFSLSQNACTSNNKCSENLTFWCVLFKDPNPVVCEDHDECEFSAGYCILDDYDDDDLSTGIHIYTYIHTHIYIYIYIIFKLLF
jgi:hypothetical protein